MMRILSIGQAVAAALMVVALGVMGACSGDELTLPAPANATTGEPGGDAGAESQKFPDILSVDVDSQDEGTATLSVTVSSPYDTPQRYADGWRVLDQDGTVLGEHTLGHDHATEQPFTRTQSGVKIPDGTTELTVEGRDQKNGYGGDTVTVPWG